MKLLDNVTSEPNSNSYNNYHIMMSKFIIVYYIQPKWPPLFIFFYNPRVPGGVRTEL